ncbi:Serine/arginine repetitive matrix protein 3 [Saguinus oedipus]|uniref:Serine/arginine repetitive matrix protein 3 n=1 Tax=Saguinus oedipus TaxID=9490 RepID=A0ABQ9W6M9_SAGOE|nr:Serine/arginine repetitive matrix protein 3 [Saguinus oedipus]
MTSTVNNGAASMPSPPDAANGFPQPGASTGAWPRAEEELRAAEPGLVKRAHREILDHERKRRVELKCMELQEMMEEQGWAGRGEGSDASRGQGRGYVVLGRRV